MTFCKVTVLSRPCTCPRKGRHKRRGRGGRRAAGAELSLSASLGFQPGQCATSPGTCPPRRGRLPLCDGVAFSLLTLPRTSAKRSYTLFLSYLLTTLLGTLANIRLKFGRSGCQSTPQLMLKGRGSVVGPCSSPAGRRQQVQKRRDLSPVLAGKGQPSP